MSSRPQREDIEALKLTASLEHSAHYRFKDSNWIFIGNLDVELSEGDVMVVCSQWGEIQDIDMQRDEAGKSRGSCLVEYVDFRSTALAVDNLDGVELGWKKVRVSHTRRRADRDAT